MVLEVVLAVQVAVDSVALVAVDSAVPVVGSVLVVRERDSVALAEDSVVRAEAPEAGSVDLAEILAAQVVADPEAGKNVKKGTVPFFTFLHIPSVTIGLKYFVRNL